MTDAVKIEVDLELMKRIVVTLVHAMEDIEAHLEQEYPHEMRMMYPTYKRRHANGFEVVTNAEACLDQLAALHSDLQEPET